MNVFPRTAHVYDHRPRIKQTLAGRYRRPQQQPSQSSHLIRNRSRLPQGSRISRLSQGARLSQGSRISQGSRVAQGARITQVSRTTQGSRTQHLTARRKRGRKRKRPATYRGSNEKRERAFSSASDSDEIQRLKNDYSQHFVDTGQRPQNFIRETGLEDRLSE